MRTFTYERAGSVAEAVGTASAGTAPQSTADATAAGGQGGPTRR